MKALKHTIYLSVFVLFLVVLQTGTAQDKSSNSSVYGAYGLGLLEQSRSPQGEGLGVYGVAFDQFRVLNLANPALLSGYAFTTGFGAVEQSAYNATQNGIQSNYSNFAFSGMGIVFPIDKGKLSVAASLTPFTTVNFTGYQETSLPGDTTRVFSQLKGSGGLNNFEFAVGYKLFDNLSVGYAPAYVFGSIKNATLTEFEDLSYRSTLYGNNDFYSGLSHTFGFAFNKNKVFTDKDRLLLGAVIRLPSTLSVERFDQFSIIQNQFEQPVSAKTGEAEIDMPLSLKFGATYYFNMKYLISSDVVYEQWSGYSSLYASPNVAFSDRIRLGFGGMYVPELRTNTGFFASIGMKLGASYDSGYFTVKNSSISKMALHAGFAIPSPFIGSSVDFNIEYGILGTQSNALIREEILSFKCVITLSEFMFFKRQIQ